MSSKGSYEDTGYSNRLIDIDDSLLELNPIFGIKATPLVSLEQSLSSDEFTELAGCIHVAVKAAKSIIKQNNNKHNLSMDEIGSIHIYTQQSPLYVNLNKLLREKNRTLLKPYFPYLKLLLSALYKLPPSSGITVYRGVNRGINLSEEDEPTWWNFSSCTATMKITQQFLNLDRKNNDAKRTFFDIQILQGFDIKLYSSYQAEDEVLLLPGTSFQVVGKVEIGSGTIIKMKQIKTPPLIDFFLPLQVSPNAVDIHSSNGGNATINLSALALSGGSHHPSSMIETPVTAKKQLYIVSGSDDNTLRIWDASSGTMIKELKGHILTVCCCSYSPDGQYIVSGSWDNTLRIWDASSGKSIKELKGHTESVYCCSYSPDGKYIVSGSYDETLRLWDASSGTMIKELKGHTNTVACCSYSPDGQYIVSGSQDQTLRLWDVRSGTTIKEFQGHTSFVRCCSYSPDGKYIVSGSYDKTLRIWDASSGNLIKELKGHTDTVYCCSLFMG